MVLGSSLSGLAVSREELLVVDLLHHPGSVGLLPRSKLYRDKEAGHLVSRRRIMPGSVAPLPESTVLGPGPTSDRCNDTML